MPPEPPLLRLQAVAKSFRAGIAGCTASVRVLERVDLDVAPEECVALQGGRGSGKTTLLLCAAGLVRPDAGNVHRRAPCAAYASTPNVHYVRRREELPLGPYDSLTDSTVMLIDGSHGSTNAPWTAEMEALLERLRRAGGASVIVGGGDVVQRLATRTVRLASGRLFTVSRRSATDGAPARVAEDDQRPLHVR